MAVFLCLFSAAMLRGQAPALTTVKDTVYKSDGSLAIGTVTISWDAFLDASNKPVFGGTKTFTLAAGALATQLVPNAGGTPSGTSYRLQYFEAGNRFREELWIVPASSPLANPAVVVSVTQAGTPGAVTYYYWCTATNGSGETLLSPARITTASHATLDVTNYNIITCATVSGATGYKAYRTTTATAPTGTGLFLVGSAAGTVINDQSNTLTTTTIPTVNDTDPVTVATVRVIGTPTPNLSIGATQVTGTAIVAGPTATQAITAPATAGIIPLQLKGNLTAAANVLEIFNSLATPTIASWFDLNGALCSTVSEIKYAHCFPGADAGEKVVAAIAALPSIGGTVNSQGLNVSQTWSQNVFSGVTKPVLLYMGAGALTWIAAQAIATPGIQLIGPERGSTVISFTPTSGDALHVNVGAGSTGKTSVILKDFQLVGPGSGTGNGVHLRSAPQFLVENVYVDDFGNDGFLVDGAVSEDVTNTNLGTFERASSYNNGNHGFNLDLRGASGDANLITFLGTDAGSNGVNNYHVETRWNMFVGTNSGNAGQHGYNIEGDENWGYLYAESSVGKDLRFGAGAARNIISWLNGATAAKKFEDACGISCGNSALMAYSIPAGGPASWGWQNFPLTDIRAGGSETTFHNDADSPFSLTIRPGATLEQIGRIVFDNRTGTNIWELGKSATDIFELIDPVNSDTRMQFQPNGVTGISAANGATVRINNMANAGAAGLAIYDGASTPTQTSLITGLGFATFKALRSTLTTVSFGATPTFDADNGNSFKITLTGNVTSSTLSNADSAQVLEFIICQDATGSWTFAWPTNIKGGMTIGSTLNTCSVQNFLYDGTNAYALSAGVSGI